MRIATNLLTLSTALALKTGPGSHYRKDDDSIPIVRRAVTVEEFTVEAEEYDMVWLSNETASPLVRVVPLSKPLIIGAAGWCYAV